MIILAKKIKSKSTAGKRKVKSSNKTKSTTVKYQGFAIRFIAVLIDMFILGLLGSMLRKTIPFVGRPWMQSLISSLYYILLWVNWNGQTVGKKLLGIKVVKVDGKKLDYQDAIVRYLMYMASALVFFLGFLWVIWDEKKQGWHDKIAKTMVVKE